MDESNSNLVMLKNPFNSQTRFEYYASSSVISALNFIAYWEDYSQKKDHYNIVEGLNQSFKLTHDLLEANLLEIYQTFNWSFEHPNNSLLLNFNLKNLDYFNAIAKRYISNNLSNHYIIDIAVNSYIQCFVDFVNIITKNPKNIDRIDLEDILAYGFNVNLKDIRKRALKDNNQDILIFLKNSFNDNNIKLYFGNCNSSQDDWFIGY